ncbi:23S rRNA methyltransferase [Marinicella sp. S1101]|uniref:RlmE family RNA methyltransferase n=1 Tax=Marinicella marina TaxID=2996016 RepID=UPI0022609045|nr:SAM-dependent methyltransferase [Marinicella marina]MCX7553965.1 23S rRNA methyltransferase [Marinicella marina]MDJ1140457.1 SAM-dependent methyltransferase [Marinicella marina]
MARSKSSNSWLKEHFDDEFVKKSQDSGYRARSAFKLEEIIDKYNVLDGISAVVDLGAAPGGWCQVIQKKSPSTEFIIGLDLLPIEPIDGVEFIQGDFTSDEVYEVLLQRLGSRKIDLVLSDMAPNLSGMNAMDQPRCMLLAEMALEFCQQALQPGGAHVVKLFQGEGFDQHIQNMRQLFNKVVIYKPKSSRPRSREVFAVATGFK